MLKPQQHSKNVNTLQMSHATNSNMLQHLP